MLRNNLYHDKITFLSGKGFPEYQCLDYYRYMFPPGSFQNKHQADWDGIPNGFLCYHCTHFASDGLSTRFIFDDLCTIHECITAQGVFQDYDKAYISGVAYIGDTANRENARRCHALIIDVDKVDKYNLNNFLELVDNSVLPRPTFIVVSGDGMHVVYIFETPIRLFYKDIVALTDLKFLLIYKIWNILTSQDPNTQYQGIVQNYRVVGSKTKNNEITKAYKIGERVSLSYLIDKITDVEAVEAFDPEKVAKRSKHINKLLADKQTTLETFHKWLSDISSQKQASISSKRKTQTSKKATHKLNRINIGRKSYDKWLAIISAGGKPGNRRLCIYNLAAWAVKCNIPEDEFIRDAYALVKPFNDRTTDKNNPFTKSIVDAIIRQYKKRPLDFLKVKIDTMESQTGLTYPREVKRDRVGCPDKAEIVQAYFSEHPDENNIAKIARECNCSRTTVYKYLNN